MINPGTIVGSRYRVVRTVGGGGMKLVYLAEDLRLAARSCALAEMIDGFTSAEAQREAVVAFQREADMLAQLNNDHIPRVIDRFSEANHHYLVMEYIDGTTLEDQLKNNRGKLEAGYVVDVAIQILETLEYLHGLHPPVIYRDLKPSNVMITADGRVKLIDFGIARFFAPLSNATMIGTQGYAPPEQYRGKVEARSDLYALGATMHHALSGRDPATEPPFSFPPLRKAAPEIDSELAAAVDQALAYDVNRRIASAAEFRRLLCTVRGGGGEIPAGATRASDPVRTQVQLSFGTESSHGTAGHGALNGPLPEAPSASSPTVVIANAEVRCPNCSRTIPADSRYCSYCAAALRRAAGAVNDPGAATVVLSPAPPHPKSGIPTPKAARRRHYSFPARHPLLLILLIFGVGFLVMKLIARSFSDAAAPAGYEGSEDRPPAVSPSAPREAVPGNDPRLVALRQALDDHGYNSVHMKIEGNTLVLSGTIPTEEDRIMVRLACFKLGIVAFRDDLQVSNPDETG